MYIDLPLFHNPALFVVNIESWHISNSEQIHKISNKSIFKMSINNSRKSNRTRFVSITLLILKMKMVLSN